MERSNQCSAVWCLSEPSLGDRSVDHPQSFFDRKDTKISCYYGHQITLHWEGNTACVVERIYILVYWYRGGGIDGNPQVLNWCIGVRCIILYLHPEATRSFMVIKCDCETNFGIQNNLNSMLVECDNEWTPTLSESLTKWSFLLRVSMFWFPVVL